MKRVVFRGTGNLPVIAARRDLKAERCLPICVDPSLLFVFLRAFAASRLIFFVGSQILIKCEEAKKTGTGGS